MSNQCFKASLISLETEDLTYMEGHKRDSYIPDG